MLTGPGPGPAGAPQAAPPAAEQPDLSIVVVSWNTRDELRECLRSTLDGLDGIAGEVVVVDNASADGSADMVAAEFPAARLVRNDDNLGFAGGCNTGLAIAGGRHLLLLNPDTVVVGDVLAATVRYLDDHPDVGAVGCRVLRPDGSVEPTCFRDPSVLNLLLALTGLAKLPRPRWFGRERMTDWQRDSERDVEVVTGCYLAVRREVVEGVGMLDDGYFFCGEESDWCRQIRRAGWAVRFAPVGEIVHESGAAGRKLDHRRELLLDAGLVRYAHKNDGPLAGRATWALLWAFAVTRGAGWALLAAAHPRPAGRRRAGARRDHFRRVVRDFAEVRRLAGLARS
ncbi:MAG TPA: glycosyltransferase family 2 protein [Acidimicrobiales bacterium]|nr:glycosyltransferase family 2 protein [Acidimicrobiales bacterium]